MISPGFVTVFRPNTLGPMESNKIGSVMMFRRGVWISVVEWPIQSTLIPWSTGSAGAR